MTLIRIAAAAAMVLCAVTLAEADNCKCYKDTVGGTMCEGRTSFPASEVTCAGEMYVSGKNGRIGVAFSKPGFDEARAWSIPFGGGNFKACQVFNTNNDGSTVWSYDSACSTNNMVGMHYDMYNHAL